MKAAFLHNEDLQILGMLFTSHITPHTTISKVWYQKLLLGVCNTEERGDLSLSPELTFALQETCFGIFTFRKSVMCFFYLDREGAPGEWRAAPRALNSRRLQSLFRPLIGQISPVLCYYRTVSSYFRPLDFFM